VIKMRRKPRGIFGYGGGARAPRHYSKFIDDAGVKLGLIIFFCLVGFLVLVVLMALF